jgi:hypothetical protein
VNDNGLESILLQRRIAAMIKLKKSETLKRRIRQDDLFDLSVPTWILVRQAIEGKRIDEALDLIDYALAEYKAVHDNLVSSVGSLQRHHFSSLGEDKIEEFLRERNLSRAKYLMSFPSVEELLHNLVEYQRGNFSDFSVKEEPDRYVVQLNTCGSGSILMRAKNVSRTKKAHSWSWSKSGVPYYCLHCCIAWEIIPTELRGYPLLIHLLPEKPDEPCVQLYYKKPELIPEEYFTRIGKTKTIK